MLFLLIGSFWFWACLVVFGLFLWAEAVESSAFSIAITVTLVCTLQWWGGIDIIEYAKQNYSTVLMYVSAYFPIGVVWSALKWYLKCRDVREDLLEKKEDYLSDKFEDSLCSDVLTYKYGKVSIGSDDSELDVAEKNAKNNAFEAALNSWNLYVSSYRPTAHKNKSRIMRWIGYWPTSMIWTLLDDFVTRIIKTIYNHISEYFEKISKKVFADV